jgi:PHD/YefM family antitoxin component YafN of YafNO toxin-antitoxin module
MKSAVKEEQFLTDSKGRRTGVLLDLKTYEHLREAEEELSDIRTYDALHDRAHAEVATGQYTTLKSYRTGRSRKSK